MFIRELVGLMGVYIHLMKLEYTQHAKAGTLRPNRPRGRAKIIRLKINYNKLDYTCGIPDDAVTSLFCRAVEKAIADKKARSLPIAMYDKKEKKAYLQYPDGSKEYPCHIAKRT